MLNSSKSLFPWLWFRAILFAAAYFALAALSDAVSFQDASFATLWLPSGLFVAVLLLAPLRDWPAYLLAALPASLIYTFSKEMPAAESALIYLGCVLEAAVGAWLVRRFDRRAGKLEGPANVLSLLVFSALVGAALSATLSTTVLDTLRHGLYYFATWRIAWIGHSLGILVMAPLVLSWAELREAARRGPDPEKIIEFAVLLSGLFVCALAIFVSDYGMNRQNYLIIPFMVWAALRFGPRGTALCGLIVALVASWGSSAAVRDFAVQDATIVPNLDALGSFLAASLVTCLFLAAAWSQTGRAEKALRESETRYRLLIENQGEGVAIVDPNETFSFANPAALTIFGTSVLVGRSLREFTDPQQFATIRQQTQKRQNGEKTTYELEIIQSTGRRRSLMITATPEYDVDGQFSGTFAVFYDHTERKQSEVALRDSRARFQTLFDHSPIPICEVDYSRVKRLLDALRAQGTEDFREYFLQNPAQINVCAQLIRVLDVNHATVQLFNFTDKAEFMAQVIRVNTRGPNDLFVEQLIAIGEGRTEFEMEGPNDIIEGQVRYHHVRWTVAPGYEHNFHRVIVTTIDVTERKLAEERMRYLSTHDVLTGLYNRNFFEAEMERLQNSRLEPVNVMVVDVNGMKATNDTYGHAAGDELLRRTAQVLRISFRKEDIIARIGGDEFVVLFHGQVPIQESVDRVKACLDEHNHWYEGAPLSLAIGAATGSKGTALVDLFRKADQQMYKEKLRTHKSKSEGKADVKAGNPPWAN